MALNDEEAVFTALVTLANEVKNLLEQRNEAPSDPTIKAALMSAAAGLTAKVKNIMSAYTSNIDVKLSRHELIISKATENVKKLRDNLGKLAKETPHLAGIIFISAEAFLDGLPVLKMQQLKQQSNKSLSNGHDRSLGFRMK